MPNNTPAEKSESFTVLWELGSTLLGLVLLLPVALIAGHGYVRAIGVAYGVLWALAMAPSASAYLFLAFDAFLIYTRRRPLMVPALIYAHAARPEQARPYVNSRLARLALLSVHANPLASFSGHLLHLAFQARPETLQQLVDEAIEQARVTRASRVGQTMDPALSAQLAIPQPLLRRMEPELACAGL